MNGRLFKIFLPILTGLVLLIAGLVVVVGSTSANGDCDLEDCEEPSPSPSPSPSPTPTPPPQGGPGPSDGGGGAQAPSCPVDGQPQKPDQVWFTDLKPGQVTVNWVNKGDASGYHIAYGPGPNNWLWGVEVGNVDKYTLKNLPAGDIWVTVIPLGGDKCPGVQSDPAKVSQVLAATGVANSALLFSTGFVLVSLGLWQAQSVIARKNTKTA